VNLVPCAAGPHLLLYGAVRRGAHQLDRAGTPPIRAREGKALSDPLGLRGGLGDQPNRLMNQGLLLPVAATEDPTVPRGFVPRSSC
jgi:hypothetical protein